MEKLTVVNWRTKCSFCGSSKKNHLKYGPTYKLGNVTAHYYCVLLSNRLIQNGRDDEGMLGFLLSDIQKELQRIRKIICVYCNKGNANIKCSLKKCRRTFHLPCGLKFGTSHQFMQDFKSFCHVHHLHQSIPRNILKEAHNTDILCCICHEKVNIKDKYKFLWAPCCLKTWYHRTCVQKLAHSAGYFFRCAACNDVSKFKTWMEKFGIFIPQQDASWELVPNAYEELLFRYDRCDAKQCKCPSGRQDNTQNTLWEIVLCESCGSQGIHVGCGNLRFSDPEWECPSCVGVTKKLRSSTEEVSDTSCSKVLKVPQVPRKKRRRSSEDLENFVLDKRKKLKGRKEEEDVEVDVVTVEVDMVTVEEARNNETQSEAMKEKKEVCYVESWEMKIARLEDPQEVFKVIKPGPLSHKLAVLEKICGDSPTQTEEKIGNGSTSSSETILIELSDSDDDVEVIEEMKKQKAPRKRSGSIFHHDVRKQRLQSSEGLPKAPDKPDFPAEELEVIVLM